MPSRLARITITSEPSGAEVFDQSGHRLGETPTEIGVAADGSALTLTLRHPRAKERTKTIAATGDMTVSVILEPLPGGRKGSSGHVDDGGRTREGPAGKGAGRGTAAKDKSDIMEPSF